MVATNPTSPAPRPDAFDTAAYARDMAVNLQALALSAGMLGLAALFRAAAAEAAVTLAHLRGEEAGDVRRRHSGADA
jgi:hypothetical protein